MLTIALECQLLEWTRGAAHLQELSHQCVQHCRWRRFWKRCSCHSQRGRHLARPEQSLERLFDSRMLCGQTMDQYIYLTHAELCSCSSPQIRFSANPRSCHTLKFTRIAHNFQRPLSDWHTAVARYVTTQTARAPPQRPSLPTPGRNAGKAPTRPHPHRAHRPPPIYACHGGGRRMHAAAQQAAPRAAAAALPCARKPGPKGGSRAEGGIRENPPPRVRTRDIEREDRVGKTGRGRFTDISRTTFQDISRRGRAMTAPRAPLSTCRGRFRGRFTDISAR